MENKNLPESSSECATGLALNGLSVNYHLWQPCNMRCTFCYATFLDVKQSILPKGHLPREQALEIVRRIAEAGAAKLTFAGGEPMLCPWLSDLIIEAKRLGLVTTMVTNGTRLSASWLERVAGNLDWVALSVDSVNPEVNVRLGRRVTGQDAPDLEWYLGRGGMLQDHDIKLKINTVVAYENREEDLSPLILGLRPQRWKILQAMPQEGQNSHHKGEFEVTVEQFDAFLLRHGHLSSCTTIVPEPVELIRGSYIMVDPAGRFFDNVAGGHFYSKPILEVGIGEALGEITFDYGTFLKRGGKYEF